MARKNGASTFPAAAKTETPFCFRQFGFEIGLNCISGGSSGAIAAASSSPLGPTTADNLFTPALANESMAYEISGRPAIGMSGFAIVVAEPRKREPVPAMRMTASVIFNRAARNISSIPKLARPGGESGK